MEFSGEILYNREMMRRESGENPKQQNGFAWFHAGVAAGAKSLKSMEKHVYGLNPLEAGASAALYGLENRKMVDDHFDELYRLMVASFNDEGFIARLRSLRGRGVRSVGIGLNPENDGLCFINRLWFNVQHSSSTRYEIFYVGMGVNLKRSRYNPFPFSKLWIAHAANGPLETIRACIASPDFRETIGRRLGDHVFRSCNDEALRMLTDGGRQRF